MVDTRNTDSGSVFGAARFEIKGYFYENKTGFS